MKKDGRVFYKKNDFDKHFEKVFNFPLTVVTAPMGYGKTTAVKHLLSHIHAHIIEITLSENQISEECLWEVLVRSIFEFDKHFAKKLSCIGLPRNSQQIWDIIEEVKKITLEVPVVIVIDDFHLLNSLEMDRVIQMIVYQNIKRLHILLIGRKQPNFDILEMQVKNLCYPIGQFELMLNPEDIDEYFKIYGYKLSEEEAYRVYQNTEGWISAIYLIMLEYKETQKIEGTRPVSKLIESLIYNKYDESMKGFLLKLSIMREFNFTQALYVTQEEKAGEYLKCLEETNAFVIYDGISDAYKIHKIMSQFLYNKLIRDNVIDKQMLFQRAGDWYLEHNYPFTAFEYYIEAKEYIKILSYLSRTHSINTIEKNSEALERIFNKVPKEIALQYPLAYLIYIYKCLFLKNKEKISYIFQIMRDIEDKYRDNTEILGEVYLAKSFLFIRDMPQLLECMVQARSYLPKGSQILCSDSILHLVETPMSLSYYTILGRYKEHGDMYIKSFQCYEDITSGGGSGMDYLIRAEYYLETARLDASALEAEKAIYKGEIKAQKSIIISAILCLSRIYVYQNKHEEGIYLLKSWQKKMREEGDMLRLHITDNALAYIYGCMNQLENIPVWIKEGDLSYDQINYQNNPFTCIIYYLVLALEREFIKLEMRCAAMIQYYKDHNILLGSIYMFI